MSGARSVLYRMYDRSGALLYVGMTCDPHSRFRTHSADRDWWLDVDTIRVENFSDRESLAEAERLAIRSEKPRYNVKDTRTHGTYSLTEIAAMTGADRGLKHPERWLRNKMREIGHRGLKIDGEYRFTRRQINALMDYQSSEQIHDRRAAARSVAGLS